MRLASYPSSALRSSMWKLTPDETQQIRQQRVCAQLVGDHPLDELCRRALEGRDRLAVLEAKSLCVTIQEHGELSVN